jgi:hypothetical protein
MCPVAELESLESNVRNKRAIWPPLRSSAVVKNEEEV